MNINALSRRHLMFVVTSLGLTATAFGACAKQEPKETPKKETPEKAPAMLFAPLAELEAKSGGRLGVSILNKSSGATIGHRADERFAMCSTFKLPLCAVILHEADQGRIDLQEKLRFSKADMVANSPVTQDNIANGAMTIAALCEATQTTSDNLAANLLVTRLGGPAVLTQHLRGLGDLTTRIDRTEPEMNQVLVGDDNDTTTPIAMMQLLDRILTTDLLKQESLERLTAWMIATKTGAKRLRAGFPADWKAGNKTGTGGSAHDMPNRYNDVAIAWPPNKNPIIITSYYESPVKSEDMRDEDQAVLAQVARIAAEWVST